MVCLGNICRSPMAEYLFKAAVEKQGLGHCVSVQSAGTSGWHNGEGMHPKTAAIVKKYGMDIADFVSSQVQVDDNQHFDYLVAMDNDNLAQLEHLFGVHPDRIFKITDLINSPYDHVPDPWHTGDFTETENLLLQSCQALLAKVCQEHGL